MSQSTILTSATSALAMMAAMPALAGELEARSKIDAVTVYPDAAAIVRLTEVELPAGATTLIFKGLPYAIDPASLRITGEAGAALTIGAVDTKLAANDAKPLDSALETKLRNLRTEREGWQVTLDALSAKIAMINRYAETSPAKMSPDAKPLDIGQWNAAFDTVANALAKTGDELRSARAKARDLDDDIKALENARTRPTNRTAPTRDVAVELEAASATKGKITLSYRVNGAGWRPIYDARLDTGAKDRKPVIEWVRRASIQQRTGEDWTDVNLAVSTIRARGGTQAPDLMTERLNFWEPPVVGMAAGGLAKARSMAPAAAPAPQAMMADNMAERAEAPKRAVEQQASVEAGAFQATFRIPGRVSVASDGSTKSLRIGSRSINPVLAVKAVPLLDETGFLEARFTNEDEVPLLAGEVNIFRDGVYTGAGRINMVAPGDATDLGFGPDSSVKISRIPVKRKENEPSWLGSTKQEAREFKTIVKNLHDFPIKITVQDRIPISENSAITIEQNSAATTPPTEKNVGDKRGVVAWSYDYAPGETKEIKLGYRMKWPADREVNFESLPK